MPVKTAILIILILWCNNLVAQNRIAAVNSDTLISRMPETAKANIVLQQYQDSLYKAAKKLEEEYDKITQEWSREHCHDCSSFGLTDSARKAKREAMISMIQAIQNANGVIQLLVEKKTALLSTGIHNKLQQIAKQVATKHGYTYVLDLSSERLQFLPLPPYDDITAIVTVELAL
jgi:Skp family chaperone for outer membrane proteins